MLFPLGFLGLHHFYLDDYCLGFTYCFTGGGFGIGWLCDFALLPIWVKKYNRSNQQRLLLQAQSSGPPIRGGPVVGNAGPRIMNVLLAIRNAAHSVRNPDSAVSTGSGVGNAVPADTNAGPSARNARQSIGDDAQGVGSVGLSADPTETAVHSNADRTVGLSHLGAAPTMPTGHHRINLCPHCHPPGSKYKSVFQ